MAKNMVLTYLHFRILEWLLTYGHNHGDTGYGLPFFSDDHFGTPIGVDKAIEKRYEGTKELRNSLPKIDLLWIIWNMARHCPCMLGFIIPGMRMSSQSPIILPIGLSL